MSKIKIITDSTSDIPKDISKELGITVVPLTVYFGDKGYRDGYDLTNEEFYEKLKTSDEMPVTSQVTPIAFEEAFKKELDDYDSLICYTISSKGSGTYQSAMIAKENLGDTDIEVVDTLNYSYGYGLTVVEAARMAKAGKSKEEILSKTKEMISKTNVYFIVDGLEYLKKGGRINSASAFIGSILDIKPLLTVKEGSIIPIDKIRGRKNVIPKMVNIIKSKGHDLSGRVVGLAHGNTPEKIAEVKEALNKEFSPKGFELAEVGSVIGAHTGPGVVGIFFTD